MKVCGRSGPMYVRVYLLGLEKQNMTRIIVVIGPVIQYVWLGRIGLWPGSSRIFVFDSFPWLTGSG